MTENYGLPIRRRVPPGPKNNGHPENSRLFWKSDPVEYLFGPPQQEPPMRGRDFKDPGPRSGDCALIVDAYQLWSPKDRLPYDKPTVQQVPLNDRGSHYKWMNSLPPRDGTSPEKRLPYVKPALKQTSYDVVGMSPKWGAGHPLP